MFNRQQDVKLDSCYQKSKEYRKVKEREISHRNKTKSKKLLQTQNLFDNRHYDFEVQYLVIELNPEKNMFCFFENHLELKEDFVLI